MTYLELIIVFGVVIGIIFTLQILSAMIKSTNTCSFCTKKDESRAAVRFNRLVKKAKAKNMEDATAISTRNMCVKHTKFSKRIKDDSRFATVLKVFGKKKYTWVDVIVLAWKMKFSKKFNKKVNQEYVMNEL